jgi:hypothetical protein
MLGLFYGRYHVGKLLGFQREERARCPVMIRAVLWDKQHTNPPTVLLGLGAENLARLKEGKPVLVNLRHLDPDGPDTQLPDINIAITLEHDLQGFLEEHKKNG